MQLTAIPQDRHDHSLHLDWDGLMANTERPQRPVYREIVQRHLGISISDLDLAWAIGASYEETVRGFNERFAHVDPIDTTGMESARSVGDFIVERLVSEREVQWRRDGIELMPFAQELLDWADGLRMPRSVATSRKERVAFEMLEASRITGRVHAIVGRDTEGVRLPKPAPDICLVSAAQLATPVNRCWHIDDATPGVRSGADAGVNVIYVYDPLIGNCCSTAKRLAKFTTTSLEQALIFLQKELGTSA